MRACAYTDDDDLVFCHPHTGTPYDASKSRLRFKDALKRAGLRELRFHDYADVFVMPTFVRKSARSGVIALSGSA